MLNRLREKGPTPFVIPSQARISLSFHGVKSKRDPSARSAPRNDKNLSFSASCSACLVSVQARSKSDRLKPVLLGRSRRENICVDGMRGSIHGGDFQVRRQRKFRR